MAIIAEILTDVAGLGDVIVTGGASIEAEAWAGDNDTEEVSDA